MRQDDRAIHAKCGDFFAPLRPRSEWDPETLAERPWDIGDTRRRSTEAEARSTPVRLRVERPFAERHSTFLFHEQLHSNRDKQMLTASFGVDELDLQNGEGIFGFDETCFGYPRFSSFTLGDEHHAVVVIDVLRAEPQHLTEADACAVHHEEQRAENDAATARSIRCAGAAQQVGDLGLREHEGQEVRLGGLRRPDATGNEGGRMVPATIKAELTHDSEFDGNANGLAS
jgi:hypothetical protein